MNNQWGEINQICCGENYQCFLSNYGELYCCGSNKFGQLGCETDSDEEGSDKENGDGSSEDSSDDALVIPKDLNKKIHSLKKRKDRWVPIRIGGSEDENYLK